MTFKTSRTLLASPHHVPNDMSIEEATWRFNNEKQVKSRLKHGDIGNDVYTVNYGVRHIMCIHIQTVLGNEFCIDLSKITEGDVFD